MTEEQRQKLLNSDAITVSGCGSLVGLLIRQNDAQAAVIERVRALAVPLLDEVVALRDALAAAPEHTAPKVTDAEYDRMCLAVLRADKMIVAANARVAELEHQLFVARETDTELCAANARADAASKRADAAEPMRKAVEAHALDLEYEGAALRTRIARVRAIWANPGSHQSDLYNALEDLCGPK